MSKKLTFKVRIMDRDFTVACKDDQQDDLLAASALLDRHMRDIQSSGKVIGQERCAIMAALNLANELQQSERMAESDYESGEQLDLLIDKIEEVLG